MPLNIQPFQPPQTPLPQNTIAQQLAAQQQQQAQQGQQQQQGMSDMVKSLGSLYGSFMKGQTPQQQQPGGGQTPAVAATSLSQTGGLYNPSVSGAQGAQGPPSPILAQMARPGVSVNGVDLNLGNQVSALYASAPPEIQKALQIGSGVRTMQEQQAVYDRYLRGEGPLAAKPGMSRHQVERGGTALDLYYGPKGTPERERVKQWVHQNAPNFGLSFPLLNKGEDWHVELRR